MRENIICVFFKESVLERNREVHGYIFQNFRVVTPLRVLDSHSVVVEGSRISQIEKKDALSAGEGYFVVDVRTF